MVVIQNVAILGSQINSARGNVNITPTVVLPNPAPKGESGISSSSFLNRLQWYHSNRCRHQVRTLSVARNKSNRFSRPAANISLLPKRTFLATTWLVFGRWSMTFVRTPVAVSISCLTTPGSSSTVIVSMVRNIGRSSS